ncbi:MAG TPA: 2-C-methyl-D-erythritol 4-phosphate cytidylyltransferase [Myxococcota bacterium]|nr:2-C-methyl-D-erythritol 4-phosphate cytidylyltransferase [Myxococcota bacterium]HRY96307.1 2-C-methyl-D-erythritol 4-phosphate cytidylyltransferase [Myxococcota bacterium]HSA20811.1 2-C-methyl-D-erythritol 4-phosphate cytidylyltransferase [Myxococcota bacterium]
MDVSRHLDVAPPPAWVLVPAAGRGERFGGPVPKQFALLDGAPLLHRTLRALAACPGVAGLAVAVPAERLADPDLLPAELASSGRAVVCAGGARRLDSVRAALQRVPPGVALVLVHDGARPAVTPALVARVAAAAWREGACAPGLPVQETLKEVDAAGRVVRSVPRGPLVLVQTPQGFRREVLEAAYRWLEAHPQAGFTDDAGLVEASGQPVACVPGEPGNLKVTLPEDLARLAQAGGRVARAAPRVGHGYDVHRLVEGRPLVLCGVRVPFERGLLGHSDADVGLHALGDAILGAACLGDLGRHFPDSDPAYAGADSRGLLAEVARRAAAAGWRVSSADLTLVVQRPRLAPHLPEMVRAIAGLLALPDDAVSVKAKTEEGLGFTGAGEGIAAHAVAVLVRTEGEP